MNKDLYRKAQLIQEFYDIDKLLKNIKPCVICGKHFKNSAPTVKTCGNNKCKFEARSRSSKRKIKEGITPIASKEFWNDERKKQKSNEVQKKYRNGQMTHMKQVWEETSKRITGKSNPRYRHGHKNGYEMCKVNGSWKPTHRVIIEQHLGRKLKKDEVVHHINHDKLDNRLENLKVMTISEHIKYHRNC